MGNGLVVLVVAGDPALRAGLTRSLAGSGRDVLEAATPADGDATMAQSPVDVLVAASRGAAGSEGLNLLRQAHGRDPLLPVVLVTDGDDPAARAELMRHGAHDVLSADAASTLLDAVVRRAGERRALETELGRLRRELLGQRNRVPLLGRSVHMREMSRQVDQLASRMTATLIVGATGTGKNVVAREIHDRSRRPGGPFVTVSCLGLSDGLLESQLFGHQRGAFPAAAHDHEGAFHAAAGGTLFLDRIEEIALPVQARLVAALKSGRITPLGGSHATELDVRLVSSANRDVAAMVRSGTFREDLHERLAGTVLTLPRLRERPEDTPLLAEAFVAEAAERYGVAPRRLDGPLLERLLAYQWPGNVRELRDAIETAFARSTGDVIRIEHLPAHVRAGARAGLARDPERRPTLAEAEAELVALVLEESGGNKTEAARRLGIDRKRLYRKIKRYGLLGDEGEPA